MVRFSVIIPSLDEEGYIGEALKALRNQTFQDFEIIVKDGESRDQTVAVATRFADTVLSMKDVSVADARNQGAEHARGSILVFVDADTRLPPYMLERLYNLIENERIIGGSCRKVPVGLNVPDRVLYEFVNISTFLSSRLCIGGAHGNCMFIRKSVFDKIGGFNPEINVAEEQELVRRARKFGKFAFLLDLCVAENPRRVRKWGRLRLQMTWFIGTINSFRANKRQPYAIIR